MFALVAELLSVGNKWIFRLCGWGFPNISVGLYA